MVMFEYPYSRAPFVYDKNERTWSTLLVSSFIKKGFQYQKARALSLPCIWPGLEQGSLKSL